MFLCVLDIIEKLRKPPPLFRPMVSQDCAPLECIQLMKQCWTEQPDKRPGFDEIFDQVGLFIEKIIIGLCRLYCTQSIKTYSCTFRLFFLPVLSVQEHQQGEEDQHYRLHAEDAGAVLVQPGGADQRANGGAGDRETEDGEAADTDAASVSPRGRDTPARRHAQFKTR